MAINWHDMKQDASAAMLVELKERVPGLPGAGAVKIREADLPFYQAHRYYEVTDMGQARSEPRFILHRQGANADETFLINGSPSTVQRVNAVAPLKLSGVNVWEYVSFFFACVYGRRGQMNVIERFERPTEEATDEKCVSAFDAVQKNVPPRVVATGEGGGFRVDAAMSFKGGIIIAEIDVPASGALKIVKHDIVFAPEWMEDLAFYISVNRYLSWCSSASNC